MKKNRQTKLFRNKNRFILNLNLPILIEKIAYLKTFKYNKNEPSEIINCFQYVHCISHAIKISLKQMFAFFIVFNSFERC